MAEKPDKEANPQSSEKYLQKLVGDGRNNVRSSSMADGEVNVNFFSSIKTRSV